MPLLERALMREIATRCYSDPEPPLSAAAEVQRRWAARGYLVLIDAVLRPQMVGAAPFSTRVYVTRNNLLARAVRLVDTARERRRALRRR